MYHSRRNRTSCSLARGETVTLTVDPVEAAIVTRVFAAYAHRSHGLAAIPATLNAEGVAPPRSGRRCGVAVWTKPTLWAMLRNAAYIGRLVYAKSRYSEIGRKHGKVRRPASEQVVVDGALPSIIPVELWEAAQGRHGQPRFGSGRPWHRPYLLSSLITCGHCGRRFQAHKQARGRGVLRLLRPPGRRPQRDAIRLERELAQARARAGGEHQLDTILGELLRTRAAPGCAGRRRSCAGIACPVWISA